MHLYLNTENILRKRHALIFQRDVHRDVHYITLFQKKKNLKYLLFEYHSTHCM